jgi:hypothetical protein
MSDVAQIESDLIAERAEYERHAASLGARLNDLGAEISRRKQAVKQEQRAGVLEQRIVDLADEQAAIRSLEDQRDSVRTQIAQTKQEIARLTREGAELPSRYRAEYVATAFEAGAAAVESARAAAEAVRKAQADAANATRQARKAFREVIEDQHGLHPFVDVDPPPGRVPEPLELGDAIATLEAYSGFGSAHVPDELREEQERAAPGRYLPIGERYALDIGPLSIKQYAEQIIPDEHGFASLHYAGPLPEDFHELHPTGDAQVGAYTEDGRPPILPPRSPEIEEMMRNWDSSRPVIPTVGDPGR